MGVITKLLYRGNDLKKGQYQHLFLDMEENIHIHYRDLRIELSCDEFKDIEAIFTQQAQELLEIIHRTDYQDGKLANANQHDTRIWTKSRLQHEVAYHPQRISIEECTDGYHLHIRNYKILLDSDDFRSLLNAFQQLDIEQEYASRFDEILELLYANELHFVVPITVRAEQENDYHANRNIIVADYHFPKIKSILTKIGLKNTFENEFDADFKTQNNLKIHVKSLAYADILIAYPEGVGQPQIYLYEYLQNNLLNADQLNQIQCQVLNAFNAVKGNILKVNLDYLTWRYKSFEKEVVFPKQKNQTKESTAIAYRNWIDFLKQNDLYFKKPSKLKFSQSEQEELYNLITDRIIEKLVPLPVVDKIYLMGSAARMEMGYYQQPFVHGNWAKLGSDIDLLIEIDEVHQHEIPESWRYINQSKTNRCDIYHIDEIKLTHPSNLESQYPHIQFYHHLFDAYLFFPSAANLDLKDQFLTQFQAQLIYSKRPSKQQKGLNQLIKAAYGEQVKNISKLNVATDNELYRFQLDEQLWVIKCYKVSGNYRSSRLREHIDYELAILQRMQERQLHLPRVLNSFQGQSVIELNGTPAAALTYLQGKLYTYPDPDYPLEQAAEILADYHNSQITKSLAVDGLFQFDDIFALWHPQFYSYAASVRADSKLSTIFEQLNNTYQQLERIFGDIKNCDDLIYLHNHGDLTPRNFIFFDSKGSLFDFQNAFYGPRLFDLLDASIEFCFGGKYIDRDDFERFARFSAHYQTLSPLTVAEQKIFPKVLSLLGLIKFIKEIRMIKGSQEKNNLRRLRAIKLGQFLLKQNPS